VLTCASSSGAYQIDTAVPYFGTFTEQMVGTIHNWNKTVHSLETAFGRVEESVPKLEDRLSKIEDRASKMEESVTKVGESISKVEAWLDQMAESINPRAWPHE
jgi:peptidoglycan hydrolase CwlO-like protein